MTLDHNSRQIELARIVSIGKAFFSYWKMTSCTYLNISQTIPGGRARLLSLSKHAAAIWLNKCYGQRSVKSQKINLDMLK